MDDPKIQALLSAVRTILATIGGILVTKGYIDDATVQAMIGAVMVITPAIWGVVAKFKAERDTKAREHVALNAGIAIADAAPGRTAPVSMESAPAVIAAAVASPPDPIIPAVPAVQSTGAKAIP